MTRRITVEDVATYPRPGMAVPDKLAFSPDDGWITYLHSAEGTLQQQLFAYDVEMRKSGVVVDPEEEVVTSSELSLEERLRRERTRTRAVGITDYAWARRASELLIPVSGAVFVKDGIDAPLREVVGNDAGPALDPRISPCGQRIAFVRSNELYVVPIEGGEPRQLTFGAAESGTIHGLAEYVAQEEMNRPHGFWWSQDGTQLAFVEVDESHIPVYRIVHQGQDSTGPEAEEAHRYPFAGRANARVRLGVVDYEGGDPVWMDLGDNGDIYLARVDWSPEGRLIAQIENREQIELRLISLDPVTGEAEQLLVEHSDVWINLHTMLGFLSDGSFVWASERSGFMHLYLYDADGRLIRPLTQGHWMVEELVGVDEDQSLVYFCGTRDGPLERHLYAVPLDGGEIRRLTEEPGTHKVALDHARRRFVDAHSSLNQAPKVTLRSLTDGAILAVLHQPSDPRIDELELAPPDLTSFRSRDGETLYAAIYRPKEEDHGPGPHPLIVSVYGGPHAQRVARDWTVTVDMRAQYLRELGFLVLKVDNRGSARRGLAFEGAIKDHLGDLEVRDQVAGVRWMVEQGLADQERVGVVGWSYGGYMAAMCLTRAPEVFKVAVAGAPVTHWDGYDTHYTERYMGSPQTNVKGYEAGSVMSHVDDLEGKLMLVHGLIDENVHFRHTARLINALIRAQKPYDLLLFPNERHMPRGLDDRIYMESRIRDYFLEHL
ncbi:MAG: S9 family peptidase [Anaerolineae bacterium]